MRIVVTGANGAVGRHVADRLRQSESVGEVVGLDRTGGHLVTTHDLLVDPLDPTFHNADVVVHLATAPLENAGDRENSLIDRTIATEVLEAAARQEVGHLVLASTAMVYGAWPDNPMPLTERGLIRPNPAFSFGVVRSDIEQLATAWAQRTGSKLTILRSATVLARGRENALANLLRNSSVVRSASGEAPLQFLHAEDYASAVETIVTGSHEGIFNVAPDGWLSPTALSALRGAPEAPVRVPGAVMSVLSDVRRRFGASTHPGLTPYLEYPWVVANDKLKARGWQPEFSNEEAYVTGHQAGRFDGVTAKRRQELALGATGAGIAVVAIALLTLMWRMLRRR